MIVQKNRHIYTSTYVYKIIPKYKKFMFYELFTVNYS